MLAASIMLRKGIKMQSKADIEVQHGQKAAINVWTNDLLLEPLDIATMHAG